MNAIKRMAKKEETAAAVAPAVAQSEHTMEQPLLLH